MTYESDAKYTKNVNRTVKSKRRVLSVHLGQ